MRGVAGAWLVDEMDIVEFLPSAHFAKGDFLGAQVHLGVIGSTHSISLSPLFPSDQTVLPALGGVRRELAAITSAWPPGATTVLSDVSVGATEEADDGWKKLMQSVDAIHIAAHGDFNKYLPRESRIPLSRQMGGGVISVSEIEDLKLSRLRLAVLNVCHSGSQQRFDSFGEIGFRSALLSAGTGAVISAGWAIQDTAAADFAQEFYGQLAQERSISNSYIKAVRLAKKLYSTPALWAAYALTVIKGPPG